MVGGRHPVVVTLSLLSPPVRQWIRRKEKKKGGVKRSHVLVIMMMLWRNFRLEEESEREGECERVGKKKTTLQTAEVINDLFLLFFLFCCWAD